MTIFQSTLCLRPTNFEIAYTAWNEYEPFVDEPIVYSIPKSNNNNQRHFV